MTGNVFSGLRQDTAKQNAVSVMQTTEDHKKSAIAYLTNAGRTDVFV